jgi:hypothetical protein
MPLIRIAANPATFGDWLSSSESALAKGGDSVYIFAFMGPMWHNGPCERA